MPSDQMQAPIATHQPAPQEPSIPAAQLSEDDLAAVLGYITTLAQHSMPQQDNMQDLQATGEEPAPQTEAPPEPEPAPEPPTPAVEEKPQEEPITREVLHKEIRSAVEEALSEKKFDPKKEIDSIRAELEKIANE